MADQIIDLVQQIVQHSSLSSYAELWSLAGFAITPDYVSLEQAVSPIQFSEIALSQQVAEFRLRGTPSQDTDAWRLVDLVSPILHSGSYWNYFELWLKEGFHITPVPAPHLESPGFKPNLFLIGAAKSGTSTIYNYLNEIPSICMSSLKEPFFFEAEYELGVEYYRRRYFKHWQGQVIVGEARHRNLYLPFIPKRIFSLNPQAKLIIILRNPIERAYSHWWYWYTRDIERLEFEQAIKADIDRICSGWVMNSSHEMEVYLETLDSTGKGIYRTYADSGYYYEQISRFLDLFPKEQIKIVLTDDLHSDPYGLIKELEAFIGIDYYKPESFVQKSENPALSIAGKNRTEISHSFRNFLRDHYQEHNAKLADYLGRDLSKWQ